MLEACFPHPGELGLYRSEAIFWIIHLASDEATKRRMELWRRGLDDFQVREEATGSQLVSDLLEQ